MNEYKLNSPVRFRYVVGQIDMPDTVRAESNDAGNRRHTDFVVYPKCEEASEGIARTLNYLVAGTVELALCLMSEEVAADSDEVWDDETMAGLRARVMKRLSEMPESRFGAGTEETGGYGPVGYGALDK